MKKGFTLIELLAVILILAILALIVSPIVMGVVESANKEASARSLEGYAEAVNNAIAQYVLDNNGKMPKELGQVESYIEAKNKENVTITESAIVKGTVSKLTAIVGDYLCTYEKSKGATCVEEETEPEESTPNLIMRSKRSTLAEEIGISMVCLNHYTCSEDELDIFSNYLQTEYNMSLACLFEFTCEDEEFDGYDAFDEVVEADLGEFSFDFYGLPFDKIKSIEFTNNKPLSGESIDISEAQNGSIMLYSTETDSKLDIKIYSKDTIVFPEDSSYFFNNLFELTSINFNGMVDLSNAKRIAGMFEDCIILTELDLSNFDTTNVDNMSRMFNGAKELQKIYVGPKFSVANVNESTSMFRNCQSLQNFNSSIIDKTNANTSATGYLTSK